MLALIESAGGEFKPDLIVGIWYESILCTSTDLFAHLEQYRYREHGKEPKQKAAAMASLRPKLNPCCLNKVLLPWLIGEFKRPSGGDSDR